MLCFVAGMFHWRPARSVEEVTKVLILSKFVVTCSFTRDETETSSVNWSVVLSSSIRHVKRWSNGSGGSRCRLRHVGAQSSTHWPAQLLPSITSKRNQTRSSDFAIFSSLRSMSSIRKNGVVWWIYRKSLYWKYCTVFSWHPVKELVPVLPYLCNIFS